MTNSKPPSPPKNRIAAFALAFLLLLPFAARADLSGKIDQASQAAGQDVINSLQKPALQIPIPEVSFTQAIVKDSSITVPFLGQYIGGVYKFLVSIVGILAAVMMMVGGFQYLTAGGDKNKVDAGKKRILDALMGMVLALGSYVLLFAINPDLVTFNNLKFAVVETEIAEDDHKCDDPSSCAGATTTAPSTPSQGKKGGCVSTDHGGGDDYSLFGQVDQRTNSSSRSLKDITLIVIHNGGYSAKGNNDTWQMRPASAHYTIERGGKIYQHVDEKCKAWHAIGGNKTGIGIELNIGKSGGKSCNALDGSSVTAEQVREACSPTDAQYDSLNRLIDGIISRTSVKKNINSIVGHCELQPSHGDPRAFDWSRIGLSNEQKKERAGDKCKWYLPF